MEIKLPVKINVISDYLQGDIEGLASLLPSKVKIERRKEDGAIIKTRLLEFDGPIFLSTKLKRRAEDEIAIDISLEGTTQIGFGLVAYKEKVRLILSLEAKGSDSDTLITITSTYDGPNKSSSDEELGRLLERVSERLLENLSKFYVDNLRTASENVRVDMRSEGATPKGGQIESVKVGAGPSPSHSAIAGSAASDKFSKDLGMASFVAKILEKATPIGVEHVRDLPTFLNEVTSRTGALDIYVYMSCKSLTDKVRALVSAQGILGLWADVNGHYYHGLDALPYVKGLELTCAMYEIKDSILT